MAFEQVNMENLFRLNSPYVNPKESVKLFSTFKMHQEGVLKEIDGRVTHHFKGHRIPIVLAEVNCNYFDT